MKHLYFIRHGQSTANITDLVGTDAQLTETGIEQAKSAGKKARIDNIQPDIIISSPITRAHDTAKLIASEIGYAEEAIEILDDLRERWFGDMEGSYLEDYMGFSREHYYSNPLSIDEVSGVEKLADLHARAEKVVNHAKQRPEETVLIVSHGALARSILKVLEDIPYDAPIDVFENAKIVKLI